MHSKTLIVSFLLALAPSALAAPQYVAPQPTTTTTTPCKTTTTTRSCTSTTTTTTPRGYVNPVQPSSSIVPNPYVQTSSSTNPYVRPTTTALNPYIQPTPTTTTTTPPVYIRTTTTSTTTTTTTTHATTTSAAPPPPPPPPPPPKKPHCVQQWFGTAPFCRGKCPNGWTVVRYQKSAAKTCDNSTPEKIILRCDNTSKNGCSAGFKKALCEWCYMQ